MSYEIRKRMANMTKTKKLNLKSKRKKKKEKYNNIYIVLKKIKVELKYQAKE